MEVPNGVMEEDTMESFVLQDPPFLRRKVITQELFTAMIPFRNMSIRDAVNDMFNAAAADRAETDVLSLSVGGMTLPTGRHISPDLYAHRAVLNIEIDADSHPAYGVETMAVLRGNKRTRRTVPSFIITSEQENPRSQGDSSYRRTMMAQGLNSLAQKGLVSAQLNVEISKSLSRLYFLFVRICELSALFLSCREQARAFRSEGSAVGSALQRRHGSGGRYNI